MDAEAYKCQYFIESTAIGARSCGRSSVIAEVVVAVARMSLDTESFVLHSQINTQPLCDHNLIATIK